MASLPHRAGPRLPRPGHPAYDRRAQRTAARQEVHDLLRQVFQARDYAWWQQRLSTFNAPWAPVLTHPGELLDDPQAVARDLFTTPARPGAGPQARFPVTFRGRTGHFPQPRTRTGATQQGDPRRTRGRSSTLTIALCQLLSRGAGTGLGRGHGHIHLSPMTLESQPRMPSSD
ncbi:CoA transferase [Streptomyces sp. NPDC046324]|uniref:CoA transferase n=1 Tax=Streptomyces sp. NPDC046324 TaxID=3154915 RepID=UPI0033FEFFCC